MSTHELLLLLYNIALIMTCVTTGHEDVVGVLLEVQSSVVSTKDLTPLAAIRQLIALTNSCY